MKRVIDTSPNIKRMDIVFWGMQRQQDFAAAVMNAFEGRAGFTPRIEDQDRAREIAKEAVAAVKEIANWCDNGDEMAFFGQVLFSLLGMATVERLKKDHAEKASNEVKVKFENIELQVIEKDGKQVISEVKT